MKKLEGRSALVTGASRGIGVHIARRLATEGTNLVLTARSREALERVASEIASESGVRVVAIAADLTKAEDRARLTAQARSEFGGIDILINNAGTAGIATFADQSPDEIERTVALDLSAPMLMTREVLPGMLARGEGHVVSISSLLGKIDTPYAVTYAAAKAGLIAFSRSLRAEFRGSGVSSSVVSPGGVAETGIFVDAIERTGVPAPRLVPLASPDAVANAVVKAIRKDKAEVLVGPPGSRLLTLSPGFGGRMMGMMGAWEMMRRMATDGAPPSGKAAAESAAD